ncbi:hypothetical protein ABK040_002753 [Willaertia magna]
MPKETNTSSSHKQINTTTNTNNSTCKNDDNNVKCENNSDNSNTIIDNNNNNDNDKQQPQFHPIACVNCRKLHKRCNKTLPSCSGCIQRGIQCEYRTPKARHRRKVNLLQQKQQTTSASTSSSNLTTTMNTFIIPNQIQFNVNNSNTGISVNNNNTPYNNITPYHSNNNNNNIRNYNSHSSKLSRSSVIDFYCTTISLGFPIIEREELYKYLTRDYRDAENLTHEERVVMALYYSIQALVEQRFGYLEDAELSAKISRNLLKEIFDEHSDLYVAGTFYYLSLFEAANGRYKNSRNYLTNVNFYLDELEDDNRTKHQKLLQKNKALSSFTSLLDVDAFAFIKNLPNHFYTAIGKELPQEITKILEKEPTQQNVNDYLRVISLIIGTLNTIAKRNLSKEDFSLSNLNSIFVENGLKIAVLSKVGIGKELIEECALKITLATEDPSFLLISESIVPLISMACQVHLQKVNEIENTKRLFSNFNVGFYHYEIIKKDYRAFSLLAKRFGKVSIHYDNVLKELESSVNRYNEMIQNNQDNTIKFFMEIMNNTNSTGTINTNVQNNNSYQNTCMPSVSDDITFKNNISQQSHLVTTDHNKDTPLLSNLNGEENAMNSNFSFFDDLNSIASPYINNNVSSSTNLTINNNDSIKDNSFTPIQYDNSNSWNDWILRWNCKQQY